MENISTVIYTDENNTSISVTFDDGKQLSVPMDAANRHWQQVQEWVNDGGVIGAYVVPPAPTNGEIYDSVIQNQKVLKALVLCLNDGSIVPGANVSNAALKTSIKAKM